MCLKNAGKYEDHHEGYSFRVSNKEGKKILELCATMNIMIWNTLFKNGTSHI